MYPVINKHFSGGFAYEGLAGSDDAKTGAEARKRMRVIHDFIMDLGLKAGISQEGLNTLEFSAQNDHNLSVHLKSSKFGIKDNEFQVPQELLIDLKKDTGSDEDLLKKMDDVDWFEANLVRRVFGHELGPNCPIAYKQELSDNYRTLIRDVEKESENTYNIIRFATLHELGHFKKNHAVTRKRYENLFKLGTSVSFIGAGMFFLKAKYPLPIRLAIGCCVGPLSYKVGAYANVFIARQHEIEADQFAATAIAGPEGEKIRQGGIAMNLESLAHEERVSASLGINRLHLSERVRRYFTYPHPYPEERIQRIQATQR